MSIITLVGSAFSNKAAVSKEVSATSGYTAVDINEIVASAARTSGMGES